MSAPKWFNDKLRDAAFELDDILVEVHPESDEYLPVKLAIDAIQDADIALEKASKMRRGVWL